MSQQQLNVNELIGELTLYEKISLLAGVDFWHTTAIPRLNIPSIRMSDGPNGIRGTKFFNGVPSNCFPCGTGLAATWDKDLLEKVGQLMGVESKMKGAHIILGPTCNMQRSPLGGRGFESFSEDPILSGHSATSIINGIQSEKVIATIKHFVCNDQEDERKSVDTILTERALREIYLKPFQMAIRDAHPKALMTAYNKINGEHVSQSKKFLQEILREEWGYKGTTMSDWFGVYSTKPALDAGLNIEMPGSTRFRKGVETQHEVSANEIHLDVIDENVRHVLNLINECIKTGIPKDVVESPNNSKEASRLLRDVGNDSIVLLKNENNLLPLKKTDKVAVIGPNAKIAQDSGGGSASMKTTYKITPFEGISSKLSSPPKYTVGASINKILPDIGKILTLENGEQGFIGHFFLDPPDHSSKRTPFDSIKLDSTQMFLSDYRNPKIDPERADLYYADFEGYFTPDLGGVYEFGLSCLGTAQLFIDGKLLIDNKTKQVAGDGFFLGMGTREEKNELKLKKDQKYKLKVEFGTQPTYTLPTMSTEPGGVYFGAALKIDPLEEIKKSVEIAKNVDKVILCIGLSKEWESEGFDRPDMKIPGYTNELVEAVLKANPNVIVVNQSGTPVEFPWLSKVPVLVQAWFGGNELGNSIADTLFGDINPSGKLSLSFPFKNEDNPTYLNFGSSKGRVLYGEDIFIGYRYYEKLNRDVAFPFGYGLSYTTFEFSNLKVDTDSEYLLVSVDVTNTGEVEGAEVVQLYVQQVNPSVIRPSKELKDFGKIKLGSKKSGTVSLKVSLKEATSYWDDYLNRWASDADDYKVLVGNSSDNVLVSGEFSTEKTYSWSGL